MSIFFRTRPLEAVVADALQAVKDNPVGASIPDRARAVADDVKGSLAWGRLLIALAIAVSLGVAAFLSGLRPELSDMYKVLLHALELYLGGLLGLITGEAIARTR